MPIKFRCNYCRQFLGISRAQAGGVVDCPSCGRSIRVPMLDGTVQPMADPELDPEDAHLARALDELARLVDVPEPKMIRPRSARDEADENEGETQLPQPLPEAIPIEMPLPPTPVVIQPPMSAVLAPSIGNGHSNDRGLLAELEALSAGAPAMAAPDVMPESPPRRIPFRQGGHSAVTISLVLIGTLIAGMVIQRFAHPLGSGNRMDAASSKHRLVDNELTGRITYKTKEGESQPDRGARILVFPQQRSGQIKLPVVGFRPADESSDQAVANAELKAMGGAAATIDPEGRYHLPIEAGTYRVLVLSHFQPRDKSPTDPALQKLLSEYFEKPDDLLGRVQHQFSPLRVKGSGDVWDHSF